MREKTFDQLLKFIKAKQQYYSMVNLKQKISDDNPKPMYFNECLYILLEDIKNEFITDKK
jgi:hypothetical protein